MRTGVFTGANRWGDEQASLHHPHRMMRAPEPPETLRSMPPPNEECRYVHRDDSDQPVSN